MDSDASDSTTCAWEIDIPVKPERARQRKPKLSRATTPTLTTTKKDKGRPSPRCAVVVEPASPSRDVGPPVRTTREVFKVGTKRNSLMALEKPTTSILFLRDAQGTWMRLLMNACRGGLYSTPDDSDESSIDDWSSLFRPAVKQGERR